MYRNTVYFTNKLIHFDSSYIKHYAIINRCYSTTGIIILSITIAIVIFTVFFSNTNIVTRLATTTAATT